MTGSTDPTDLSPVASALQDQPGFLAGWLGAAPAGPALGGRLGLSDASLQRLMVCRTPHPDRYLADLMAIADYVGVDTSALASALREAAALTALKSTHRRPGTREPQCGWPPGRSSGHGDRAASRCPRRRAACRSWPRPTWLAAPDDVRRRRDVQSAVVWATPAMVVSLPHLHLNTANQWLAERGVASAFG